jgi:holo-[acyl-carrier protein] synthase
VIAAMLRTGVDIIEVARVKGSVERLGERFLQRIFTDGERAHCRDRYESLAALFAAKEAVSKALGTGIKGMSFTDIEITHDELGRPCLVLHGDAARMADEIGLTEWSISLSHTRDMAVAFVVALG